MPPEPSAIFDTADFWPGQPSFVPLSEFVLADDNFASIVAADINGGSTDSCGVASLSASQTDFDFVRMLVEEDLIPDDVHIQVLVQCRQELIERTYECLEGAPRAIVHFYNSTNPLQREVVFGLDKEGIIDVAVNGAKLCRKLEHAAAFATLLWAGAAAGYKGGWGVVVVGHLVNSGC